MEFDGSIIFFFIGFFLGAGIIIIVWFLNINKSYEFQNPKNELISLKSEMQSIHSTIQNFSVAQAQKEGVFASHFQNFLLASDKMNATADRLNNTLIKGGSQQQGAWGEFVLNNILDSIGFREGEEYETQKTYSDSDGNIQKPDVVVHMPGKRDIIIDSKVSLVAWDQYTNTTDEVEKNLALKKHIESIKKFIRDLNIDSYAKLYDIESVDSVIMFMPVEPAYHVLAKEGKSIVEEALQKKIAIVGPSTLYYCLKVVEHMWSVDQQNKNAKNIADQASNIYDQATRVYESFSAVLEAFRKLTGKLDEAKNRLQDGRGSLLGRVEKLKELGRLATKKKLPKDITDE
ncbi:DNA recombination protein RmuC [Alphaproteobacteria bacterium]|nr:DNA recombination protein RmuC [Alphaproteobacteria bacterium]